MHIYIILGLTMIREFGRALNNYSVDPTSTLSVRV